MDKDIDNILGLILNEVRELKETTTDSRERIIKIEAFLEYHEAATEKQFHKYDKDLRQLQVKIESTASEVAVLKDEVSSIGKFTFIELARMAGGVGTIVALLLIFTPLLNILNGN